MTEIEARARRIAENATKAKNTPLVTVCRCGQPVELEPDGRAYCDACRAVVTPGNERPRLPVPESERRDLT